jgi:hypothetical protein
VRRCQKKRTQKNSHVTDVLKVLRTPWSQELSISILSKWQYNVSQSTSNIITNILTL